MTASPSVDGGVALQVSYLSKGYDDVPVLKAFDLAVPAGQFVSIVGRSGCGKSTLLRLIAGLDDAGGGEISVDRQPLQNGAAKVRMMFQDARLLPWLSVLDNVGLGLRGAWKDKAKAALQEVGLEDHAGKWPSQLSGGQRQRVALARALIHEPQLLLLDEPLGALDALTRIEMQDLIEDIRARHGFTVLLVTHDVEEAIALGDRVLVIDQGTISLDQDIALPRPRVRGDAAFTGLEAAVLKQVLSSGGPKRRA
ncbi:ATP-binding cassette domain-containing protein [Agrobacterium tumefaciens]|uniref:ATP-binding cassette domain-containing protein n=1 Tax=Agrobacterium tumefaciens TaxID=358 RepID=UPI0021CFEE8C|nr:ATP-binding cassette domain-containing protein [Agrobacterium tumefaciens]NTZ63882.1 ATP-binding cassette domain-containing protein [Agrobacterium tumefaciens]UXT00229.1 ATP-binding cassette domain-containing protein [Agrobacterium tumefaciens]UXT52928.1 ATP-binding cassette domain-containing protein [Agrobacterium tumefaciens]